MTQETRRATDESRSTTRISSTFRTLETEDSFGGSGASTTNTPTSDSSFTNSTVG